MSERLTEDQVAKLSEKLDAEAVAERALKPGSNVMLSYVEGHYCIRKANEVFGFGGWRRRTEEMRCVFEGEREGQKGTFFQASYVARVTVGVHAEGEWLETDGWGYGEGIDYNNPGQAHESAVKEAETDAMKRALVKFGDPFGLALYDKRQPNVENGKPAQGAKPQAQPHSGREPSKDSEFGPCPECGGELRRVKRKDGEGEFIGCANYREGCKFTCNVEDALSPEPQPGYDEHGQPLGETVQSPIKNWGHFRDAVAKLGIGEPQVNDVYAAVCAEQFEGMVPDRTDVAVEQWQLLYDAVAARVDAGTLEDLLASVPA